MAILTKMSIPTALTMMIIFLITIMITIWALTLVDLKDNQKPLTLKSKKQSERSWLCSMIPPSLILGISLKISYLSALTGDMIAGNIRSDTFS